MNVYGWEPYEGDVQWQCGSFRPKRMFLKMQQAREFWIYGRILINMFKIHWLTITLAGCIF